MSDFKVVLSMLTKANINFCAEEVDGEEYPCINIPSSSPFYTTGVSYSFNDDGSLFAVHPYEPVDDED